MGEETKILFENIKNFRHLITEAVSDADMAKYINNHEHILIYYQGDETTASGKRAIRPYVLGTNKSGNKVIRAWEDNGASWHFSNKPTRPSNNPNMTDSDKHDYWTDEKGVKPGWRMFRLDKIQQVYPTGQKFNDENGLVMIPAGYHEGGDKDMVSIDAYVSTKTEPDFEQQYDKEFQGDVISKQDQLKQKWDSIRRGNKNTRKITAEDIIKLRDIASRVMKKKHENFLVVIDDKKDLLLITPAQKKKYGIPETAIMGSLPQLYDSIVNVNKTPDDKFFKDTLNKAQKSDKRQSGMDFGSMGMMKEDENPTIPHKKMTFFK